jgi:hypothetical protein
MNMPPLKIPKDIQVFNGMNQLYYFILDFVLIITLIAKLLRKMEVFLLNAK